MAAIAEATGSVISAVLFGALAGAGVLPFPRQAFEGAIQRGGVGIKASLAAFTAGLRGDDSGVATVKPPPRCRRRRSTGRTPRRRRPRAPADPAELLREADAFPAPARAIVRAGIERTADYQGARLRAALSRPSRADRRDAIATAA